MSISVIGLSLGAQSCVIAQAKRGGVDVILNESSKRLNPSLVSFVDKERALGEAASTQVRSYVTARARPILRGAPPSCPDVQRALQGAQRGVSRRRELGGSTHEIYESSRFCPLATRLPS